MLYNYIGLELHAVSIARPLRCQINPGVAWGRNLPDVEVGYRVREGIGMGVGLR
jgi:hypothetical protein